MIENFNFYQGFNFFEGILWIVLAVVIYYAPVFHLKGKKDQRWLLAVTLILFGISDFIEMNTGAWWRPYWLLIWKAICLGGIGIIMMNYYKNIRSRK